MDNSGRLRHLCVWTPQDACGHIWTPSVLTVLHTSDNTSDHLWVTVCVDTLDMSGYLWMNLQTSVSRHLHTTLDICLVNTSYFKKPETSSSFLSHLTCKRDEA